MNISIFFTSPTNLSNFLSSTSVNRKLRETGTITHHIVLHIFIFDVIWAFSWHFLMLVKDWLSFASRPTLILQILLNENCIGLPHALISRPRKLFLGRSFIPAFLTARLMTTLNVRLEMRVVTIFFNIFLIFLMICLVFPQTTFLHLALVAVFVFIKAFIKFILLFSLHKSDPVLINQRLDLAGSFGVVRNSSIPSWSI